MFGLEYFYVVSDAVNQVRVWFVRIRSSKPGFPEPKHSRYYAVEIDVGACRIWDAWEYGFFRILSLFNVAS